MGHRSCSCSATVRLWNAVDHQPICWEHPTGLAMPVHQHPLKAAHLADYALLLHRAAQGHALHTRLLRQRLQA